MTATDDTARLAERFEAHRAHLRGVAYRMLGSLAEAEDAVQDTWLRLQRAGAEGVDNLGGWLTTVVGRICLDRLRARRARGEPVPDAADHGDGDGAGDPAQEAEVADSVGLALLVVLDSLAPAERVAFVLHDLFDLPFEQIAPVLGRRPAAARQLASRARRRLRGRRPADAAALQRQRPVVDAFLAALREGDVDALLAVLDPDLVVGLDQQPPGAPAEIHGARTWARQAMAFSKAIRFAAPAVVDGALGVVWAPRGVLSRALRLTIREGRIARIEVVAAAAGLRRLDIAIADHPPGASS